MYTEVSYKFLTQLNQENNISRIANILEISPQLIAGAIVEEADAEENQSFLKDVLSDSADNLTLLNLEK